ncbi:hypothetical protein Q1695_002219 [Nippostrongylus brasiliensis]|nr:hypothetical protein Q1695_002219 [Nippostrongylus brasiliensis]
MIDWQATEILAGCLFTALFLALALIVGQCLLSCFENWRTTRRKTDAEHLPDDYVEEIRRLLERHRKVMNEYDFPEADAEDGDIIPQAVHPVTESALDSPARVRSRSNSAKLQRLKEELSEFQIEPSTSTQNAVECDAMRRSWRGLNDSVFDPVELPNSLDASVQTTATLDRMRAAQKIETTV